MVGRVLLGKKGSNYGLYVSRPGKEVTTVGREDLIFSSDDTRTSQVLKIIDVTLSSAATATVNYNGDGSSIGYIPFIIATEVDGDEIKGLPWEYAFSAWTGVYNIGSKWKVSTTNSAVTIADSQGASSSGTFRVLVFAIPAIDGS